MPGGVTVGGFCFLCGGKNSPPAQSEARQGCCEGISKMQMVELKENELNRS